MSDFEGTPADLGFYMPPEWSTHERCWMAWPQDGVPWLDAVDVARSVFADVARQISLYEPVTMVAAPWQGARVADGKLILDGQGGTLIAGPSTSKESGSERER